MAVTYLLYTPIRELEGGINIGGPMCIKTSSFQAYVGFATEALAKQFCARWRIDESVKVILTSELGANHVPLTPEVKTIVRFPDVAVLNRYFTAPETFPCEQYFFSDKWVESAA